MPFPDPLSDEPFSWRPRADGSVVIRYHDAPITVLRGTAAERFNVRMATAADGLAAQQLMARAAFSLERWRVACTATDRSVVTGEPRFWGPLAGLRPRFLAG